VKPANPPVASSNTVRTDTGVKQVTDTVTGEKVKIPLLPDELDLEPVGANYIEDIRDGGGSQALSIDYRCADGRF
jgi:hypothetical protein